MQRINAKKIKLPLFLFMAVCVFAAGIWLVKDIRDKERAAREHAKAQEAEAETEAVQEMETLEITLPETEPETEEETEPYVSPIDFEELWKTNQDVIGWITIPGTNIDYPILYGEDNEQYLHTDIEGNDSVAGCIYLDFEDKPDFSSLHNIIYGHHMKNGSMFKDIVKFKEQAYFDEHSDIYIYTPKEELHLKAFAALYTSADAVRRRTRFSTREKFDAYVEEMTKGALTGAEPENPVNKLYSLVTCSYEFSNARTIVYAYELEEDAENAEDTENAENTGIYDPDSE